MEANIGAKYLVGLGTPFMSRFIDTVCTYKGNGAYEMYDGIVQSNTSGRGLTLIKDNNMSEIKVGDKVKLTSYERYSDHRAHRDQVGTVVRGGYDIRVQWDDGSHSALITREQAIKVEEIYASDEEDYDRLVVTKFTFKGEEHIVTADSDDDSLELATANELARTGWTLKTDQDDVKELTLDEIATKFGVDVSKVRIKE